MCDTELIWQRKTRGKILKYSTYRTPDARQSFASFGFVSLLCSLFLGVIAARLIKNSLCSVKQVDNGIWHLVS